MMIRATRAEMPEVAGAACEFMGIDNLAGTGSPGGKQGLPNLEAAEAWFKRGAALGNAGCRTSLPKVPLMREALRKKGLPV
jgi:hypothetical protein